MTWVDYAGLALTVVVAIVGGAFAFIRPMVKTIFEQIVVARLNAIEEKLDTSIAAHDRRLRDVEHAQARMEGALQSRGCLGNGTRCVL